MGKHCCLQDTPPALTQSSLHRACLRRLKLLKASGPVAQLLSFHKRWLLWTLVRDIRWYVLSTALHSTNASIACAAKAWLMCAQWLNDTTLTLACELTNG